MSGGQIIKRKLQKAYGLERDLAFYDFEVDREKVSVDEMNRIQEWLRDGINNGVGDDQGTN